MKKLFSILLAAVVLCGGFVIGGCNSGSDTPPFIPANPNYQQKIINPTSAETATSMNILGESEVSVAADMSAVNVSFSPESAQVKVWIDTDIATLVGEPEKIGGGYLVKFKPQKLGGFVITAESGSITKTSQITVSSKAIAIDIKGYSEPLNKDATVKLTAQVTPASSTSPIRWASSDNTVATVDQNGLVTAKKSGVATITATATDGAAGSSPVTGFVDVTVKGFFLNDTIFVLCQKDVDDDAVATAIGITDGVIAWTSSDTNLFTVEDISEDTKRAKLTYKNGAFGMGEVTATLASTSGNYTAKATVVVAPYFMLALGDSIAAGYSPKPMGEKGKDQDMAEQDMIDAYEKYLNRRKGGTDPNYVNEFCYSAKLKDYIAKSKNVKLQSYANTGDQTKDLIEKLKPDYRDGTIATKKGEILEAVKQADYITLCIGANDILQRATGMNIMFRDLDWFRATFTQDMANFKTRFDDIISQLVASSVLSPKIYVMSVYSPYHYFVKGNIPDAQFNPPYGYMTSKIVQINNLAEEFIVQLNDYIKSKADANVSVTYIDVAAAVNAIPAESHKNYIHADPHRFDFEGLASTMGNTIPIWFDPHPTKAGAVKIAQEFEKATYD